MVQLILKQEMLLTEIMYNYPLLEMETVVPTSPLNTVQILQVLRLKI